MFNNNNNNINQHIKIYNIKYLILRNYNYLDIFHIISSLYKKILLVIKLTNRVHCARFI